MPRYRPVDTDQSFPALEEEVLARWREHDVFHETLRRREGAPLYVFYEGPPTANGAPGAHHVLSRVFKDIFPRYKTMCGFQVPRKAGWDCHGLPVELEVERQLGIKSKHEIEEYGIAEFNQRCRESVFSYVEEWNRLTERIAFWIDLDDAYVTLANEYIESVWWALKRIWEDDLLYEGHKVVPYCPRCGTALSSHEVALGYHDVVDPSVYVRFPVREPRGPLDAGDALLIWTTTPWTLVSNAAVAIDPELEYVRARVGDEVLVVAAARVEAVLGEEAEVLDRFRGTEIAGTAYEPPFPFIPAEEYGPRAHTVLGADFVSADDGTGLVHTAIAFGEDDFRLGEQYGLNVVNPVRPDGTYDERIGPYAGRYVKDADPDLVADLTTRGLVFRAEEYEHPYPHCWRCDTPLLYYAKAEWYIRTTARKDELLKANESIEWYPFHIKHGRFGKWLENNVDWALSRERYWGTPLPVWRCDEGHDRCVGSIAELRELAGNVPEDLHKPYIDDVAFACPDCGAEMRRVPEVIDAWFDSGAMPFAQFHHPFENEELFEQRFPADFICEALDQTRGWFYSLLVESVLLFGQASYKNVLCLGLILDPDGQKMSKSRGNVVAPWEVIERHGADAFRWYYFTSQQPWSGYRFSLEAVGESVRKFLLTLWNTYSFYVLYANVEGFDHMAHDVAPAARPALDRWALSRLQNTIAAVRDELDDYDTTSAGRSIAAFVDDLSNWYVRRSRRRFWRSDEDAEADSVAAYLTLHESPRDGLQAARPVHALRGRRDLRQPRRRRDLRSPVRLSRAGRGAGRPRARDRHGGRAPHRRAWPRGAQPGEGEGPPAAPRGGRRGRRARAEGDRAARGPGAGGVERQGHQVRERSRGARRLRGEAELQGARPTLRVTDARGGEGDRRAGPRRGRRLLGPRREHHDRGWRQGGVAGAGGPVAGDAAARWVPPRAPGQLRGRPEGRPG